MTKAEYLATLKNAQNELRVLETWVKANFHEGEQMYRPFNATAIVEKVWEALDDCGYPVDDEEFTS